MDKLLKTNSQNSQSSFKQIESGEIHRENRESTTSAFMIANHKERYQEKTDISEKQAGLNISLAKPKDNTPRLEISVDFAASQWFQILLVHLNSRYKKLSGVLEPIGECHFGLNG